MNGEIYTFEAAGRANFPYELLANERCFPASKEDAANAFEYSNTLRIISLKSHKLPNKDLWRSYGWNVRGLPDALFAKEDYTIYHTWPC